MHAALPLLAAAVATTAPVFHATATHTHRFAVSLPVDEAFPLFEPIGEKNWADGWHPVFASTESAALADGSVQLFTQFQLLEHLQNTGDTNYSNCILKPQ